MAARLLSPKLLLERDVDRQVKDFMAVRGWRVIRFQRMVVPGAFQTGEPGIADRMFVRYLNRNGLSVTVWIELKRAKRGKLSEDQIKWRAREEARGGVVLLVNDVDEFRKLYVERFGWLHTPEWMARLPQPAGHQTRMELAPEEEAF